MKDQFGDDFRVRLRLKYVALLLLQSEEWLTYVSTNINSFNEHWNQNMEMHKIKASYGSTIIDKARVPEQNEETDFIPCGTVAVKMIEIYETSQITRLCQW